MDSSDAAATLGVQDLFARYAHRIDRRDFAGWADLFTEDAVFDFGDQHCDGRAAMKAFMEGVMTSPGGAHIITNVSVRGTGDGRYEAVADYLLTRRTEPDGPWATIGVGYYETTAVLDGDTWRFAQYRIVPR